MFKNPTEVFEAQFNKLFEKHKDTGADLLLKVVNMVLYQNNNNIDMQELYHEVGLDTFNKIISLFDGRDIKFYRKEEIKDTLILALCFYYKEILNMEWDAVKKEVPFEINTISMGLRLKMLNYKIKQEITRLFVEEIDNGEKDD